MMRSNTVGSEDAYYGRGSVDSDARGTASGPGGSRRYTTRFKDFSAWKDFIAGDEVAGVIFFYCLFVCPFLLARCCS